MQKRGGGVAHYGGVFQGDSLSPLLFVLSMVSLSLILTKVNVTYELVKKEYNLNHLLFMDDLKLFSKSEEQMDTLVKSVHVFSTDIGMEFGTKKWGVLTMKREEVVRCKGIKLPNSEVMKEVEKEGYTYLSIVELDKIKENEMKETGPKIKTKWEKQNNSNKCMGSGCIKTRSRNTTVQKE